MLLLDGECIVAITFVSVPAKNRIEVAHMSQLVVQRQRSRLSRFFVRQFDLQHTKHQDRFDALFGVVLPVLCFEFDPAILKGELLGRPLAGEYQLMVYSVSAVQITTMVIWLTWRDRLKSFNGPIAGVLFLGGLFSTLIGILLLPFSIFGLIILIGAAGFTPLFTGFVYLRNSIRGFKSHERNHAFGSRFSVGFASALIALSLPLFVAGKMSVTISDSISSIIQSDIANSKQDVSKLRMMPVIPDHERLRLVLAYAQETDPIKKDLFRRLYSELTGENIENSQRRRVFRD